MEPKLSDFSAVIFDMDGVITDSEHLHAVAEQALCRECGFEVPIGEWHRFKGMRTDEIFADLFVRFGARPVPDMRDLLARKTIHYAKLLSAGVPSVPRVTDFIREIRPRVSRIGLCTSSDAGIQQDTFRRLGIGKYFDAVTTGDELRHGKPHPEPYLRATRKLGLPASACLVIEDSDNGIRSAVAAGCTVAGITTSFPRDVLTGLGAKIVFDSYPELALRLGFSLAE